MTNHDFNTRAAQWDLHQDRVERAHLIAEKILALIPITQKTRIMDFGCGTGLLGFNFVDKAQSVTFADTSKGMLTQVESKAQKANVHNVATLNLTEVPAAGTYDLIVSLLTLHHIEDTQASVSTLANLLAPGGHLCLCDLDAEDGSFHGEKIVPHNGFARSDIERYYRNSHLQDVSICTGLVDKKLMDGKEIAYPIFIAIGRKS